MMELNEEIKRILTHFDLNEKEQDELYKKIKQIIKDYKNEDKKVK